MKTIVYQINVNKHTYYGITENQYRRKERHLKDLQENRHCNPILQRSFNLNNDFHFIVKDVFETREEAIKEEIFLISATDCCNIALGGDGGDTISQHPRREEIIKAIQESRSVKGYNFSTRFLNSQGKIKERNVWGNYTCNKCKKEVKGKGNLTKYHNDNCGKPTKKWFNNGLEERFAFEPLDKNWIKGRIKK